VGRRSSLSVAAVLIFLVSACSNQSTIDSLPSCEDVACSGVINGAAYEIALPDQWNGTLVLYSHGYRNAQPIPPDFAPVNTAPDLAPGWAAGDKTIANALLAQGYALAGSAFSANGWAVREGVEANADLLGWFIQNIAPPIRVLAWGESLGGLITAEFAQGNPDVDGALVLCGALAGAVPNMDLGLTAMALIADAGWPELPLSGYGSYEEALAAGIAAAQIVVQMADVPSQFDISELTEGASSELDLPLLAVPEISPDPETVIRIAQFMGGPSATRQFDGSTPESALLVAVESLITAVTFGTLIRYELSTRFGGEVGQDLRPDGVAVTEGNNDARRQAALVGNPSGELVQPTLTLHTIDDSVTIAANVGWFAERVASAQASDQLRTLFTVPPEVFPTTPGAPYGAGHCNFAPEVKIAALDLLNAWIDGDPPEIGDPGILGPDSGYVPDVEPPRWPVVPPA
jgi:pimeloyl-ACP methyl ester carboxylesterase